MNALTSSIMRLRAHLRSRPRAQRELLWLSIGLALGLVAMPPLVWAVGRLVIGAYANGGVFAFWLDALRGLGHGSTSAWMLLAGPYVLLMLARSARFIWRGAAPAASG